MDNFITLFIVPFFSAVVVLFTKPVSQNRINILLKFSGAFLFGIIILHLIPEIFSHAENIKMIGLFVIMGILIQSSLEMFSKGVEHGHNVKTLTLSIFFSICIHAFIEGMPLSEGHIHENHSHDDSSLLLGVVLHKIPVAIILLSLFLKSYSKIKTILFIVIFSLMSPLGSLIGGVGFFREYHNFITAVATGILIHVSTFMIYGEHEAHDIKLKRLLAIIIGFAIAFLVV